jgi:environmental stress-induced protein Ves
VVDGVLVRLARGQVLEFAGEASVSAVDAGPSEDLNLMVRRGTSASLAVTGPGAIEAGEGEVVIVVELEGARDAIRLDPGEFVTVATAVAVARIRVMPPRE